MSMVDFPEHWKMVRFGEVATFTKKPRGLKYPEYDKIPFVPMDLIPIAKLFSEKFTLKTNDELRSGTYFEPGDILLAKITPSFENGKQCIIEDLPTSFGIATTEVIPMREVVGVSDKFYLFYYLLLPDIRTLLAGKMQGTTGRQRLSKGTLVNLEIPLPPLPEQRAIAHVLQTIQEAKSARQRELALERERKAALMDHLFSYGTKGEPRKQTEIGEIPESWKVVSLGEIVTLQRGKDLPVQSRHAEDIPIVGSNGIVGWHNEPVEGIPIPGVATGRSGSIGLLTYIDQAYWPLNTALYVRDFHGNNPLFVYYWLHLFPFEKYSQGVSVPTLNRNLVHPVPFRLPPLTEQAEVAEILQAFDTKIAALEQEAERLDELFHAMLDELMTGQRSAVSLIDAELPN